MTLDYEKILRQGEERYEKQNENLVRDTYMKQVKESSQDSESTSGITTSEAATQHAKSQIQGAVEVSPIGVSVPIGNVGVAKTKTGMSNFEGFLATPTPESPDDDFEGEMVGETDLADIND